MAKGNSFVNADPKDVLPAPDGGKSVAEYNRDHGRDPNMPVVGGPWNRKDGLKPGKAADS